MSELAENYSGVVALLYMVFGSYTAYLLVKPRKPKSKQIPQRPLAEKLAEAASRPYQAMQDCPHCGHLDIHPFVVRNFLLFLPVGNYLELTCTKCKKDWKQNA